MSDGVQANGESPSEPEKATGSGPVQTDSIDWSEALRAVKGDPTLLRVIMQTFLEETPHLLERIQAAIACGDAAALKIAAHSLKGSFRYLGIAPAFEEAFRLEKMGQEGSLDNAPEVLEGLKGQIARIVTAVSQYLRGNAGRTRQ